MSSAAHGAPGRPASGRPDTIAVDGPAASGKSTIGRRVADALGYVFFDSGALYRAITALALREGIAVDDGPALARLARTANLRVVERSATATGYAVLAGPDDVTPLLRQPEVNAAVSTASRHLELRSALLGPQRSIAGAGKVLMAGRDIGTVVLPGADLKIYLDASLRGRARRRFRELIAAGEPTSFAAVYAAVEERDCRDSTRSVAPLGAAPDAVRVNTDLCTVADAVRHVLELVQRWPDPLTTEGGEAPCRPQ